jgi:hypothetical protein
MTDASSAIDEAMRDIVTAETVEDVRSLANDILREDRQTPIVCLTSRSGEDVPAMDPTDVRGVVGRKALVWFVRTGDMTTMLQRRLGRFGVTDGAVRIYWAGVGRDSDQRDHPLIHDPYHTYGIEMVKRLRHFWELGPNAYNALPTAIQKELELLRRQRTRGFAEAARLSKQVESLSAQLQRTKDRARRAEEQVRNADRPSREEPGRDLRSARGPRAEFFLMVAAAWAAALEREEHHARPLQRMTFHDEFLSDLARLTEGHRRRTARVCAMVASGRAAEIDGLQLHPLRTGQGPTAPQTVREDGAKAMRCSVQRNAPAAIRLHFWQLSEGAIEFANVAVHDHFRIAH